MDKKLILMIFAVFTVLIVSSAIIYFLVLPSGIISSPYDISNPNIIITESGNIAVLYQQRVHMSESYNELDMVLTVYDKSGKIISGPRKLAHLNQSVKPPGIYIPHPQAKLIIDKNLNAYILQIKKDGYGGWKNVPYLSIINAKGEYIVKDERIRMNWLIMHIPPHQAELYAYSLIVASGYLHIFIYVEHQAESELHYFKYTLTGEEVTKDTLLIYRDNYTKRASMPILHIGGDIYVLKNSTHMLVINGTTSQMHYEPLQKRTIKVRVELSTNYMDNVTFNFLKINNKYYPLSRNAAIYGEEQYVFYNTWGGCVGGDPTLYMAKYHNWNVTVENQTLFKPKHATGTWCYNPDIFGIKAVTDEEGYIYLTWYVNNGCNNFFGYVMILKDTQIIVPPIELPPA